MSINLLDGKLVRRKVTVTHLGTNVTEQLHSIDPDSPIVITLTFLNLREGWRQQYVTGIEPLDASLRALSGIPHILQITADHGWTHARHAIEIKQPAMNFVRLGALGSDQTTPRLAFRVMSVTLRGRPQVSITV